MPPANKLFRPLGKKGEHLVDQPRRLGAAEPAGANQISDELLKLRHRQKV